MLKKTILLVLLIIILVIGLIYLGDNVLDKKIQADPSPQWQTAEIAIVLGFGYGLDGYRLTRQSFKMMEIEGVPTAVREKLGSLKEKHYHKKARFQEAVKQALADEQARQTYAGIAMALAEKIDPKRVNLDLLRWALQQPKIKTVLAQEAVFVAPETLRALQEIESTQTIQTNHGEVKILHKKDGGKVRLMRIHRHHPQIYVNTPQSLAFAAERLGCLRTSQRVLLVAHDLQLRRAAELWHATKKNAPELFRHLELEIPDLQKEFSGSGSPVHLWTAIRGFYACWEFFKIPRWAGKNVILTGAQKEKVRIVVCVDLDGQS